MYSSVLLDRFYLAQNAGDLDSAESVATEGNPVCGDVVQIAIETEEGLIKAAKFRALGCVVAISASDAVCELVIGRTLSSAEVLDSDDVEGLIGSIDQTRHACLSAPIAALRSAVKGITQTRASS